MTQPSGQHRDNPLHIEGSDVVLRMTRDESRLLARSLADARGTGNTWVDDLVHALRSADGEVTSNAMPGRASFFHTLFATAPVLSEEAEHQARRLDAAVGDASELPSQMATLAAHALASTYEARSAMVHEVERLIALEALSAEVAVTVAATRAEQAAADAQDARAVATARAAEAMVETVNRTAADVRNHADASASRVAEAAILAATVVRAALESPGADAATTAARIATIVASAAAANAVDAHEAAVRVADDAISAAFETATIAAQAEVNLQAAVGVAAVAAQADADTTASEVATATARSRRAIAHTGM